MRSCQGAGGCRLCRHGCRRSAGLPIGRDASGRVAKRADRQGGSSTDCVVHVVEQSYDAEAEYDHERNGDDDEDDPPPYDEHDRQRDQDRDEVRVLRRSLRRQHVPLLSRVAAVERGTGDRVELPTYGPLT